MKSLVLILVILFSQIAKCDADPFQAVTQCVQNLRETEARYRKWIPRPVLVWDRTLFHMTQQLEAQELNLLTLSRVNEEIKSRKEKNGFHYLLANAGESCRAFSEKIEKRMRSLVLFGSSLVISVLGIAVYLLVFGVPQPFIGVLLFSLYFSPMAQAADDALVIYAYDSFAAKEALGGKLAEEFEKLTHKKLRFVPFSSAGEALNQAILEGGKSTADLVVGVDNASVSRAKATGLFESLGLDTTKLGIDPKHFIDPDNIFYPFDYGYLAYLYDSERSPELAKISSLKEFSETVILKKRVVMADPRSSSIGFLMLWWAQTAFGDQTKSFWKLMGEKIVTYPAGWSGSYSLFLKGTADSVLSYTTSPAYHLEKENKETVKALLFSEGHFKQVESFALTKSSSKKALAKQFAELLLSKKIQTELPTLQWMFPVVKDIPLPKSFAKLISPKEIFPSAAGIEKSRKEWIQTWMGRSSKQP